MTGVQRRVVFAICVIVGLTLLVAAGLTFLVAPMAVDLGLSDASVEDILMVPTVAALLVVFIAGRAGDRWGSRRTILAASGLFTLGSVVLAGAGGQASAQLGLALCGIGAIIIQVVALSLLQHTASEGKAHVSAFTSFSMVFPIAFLVLPILTAAAVSAVSWRWVPIAWAITGAVIAVISMALLERDAPAPANGEWLTPLLAGVALAAGSTALSEIDNVETEAFKIEIGAGIGLAAAAACAVAVRRIAAPSFSLAPLRITLMRPLMIAVMLVSLVQLLTYVSIILEYLYDMTAIQAAAVIAPAQLGAVLGAKFVARKAIAAWGLERAGQRMLLLTGLTTIPLVLMRPSMPVVYLVIVSTLFSCTGMAALSVLNLDVMGRAPMGATGAVSSLRTAASSVGSALGMAILGTIVLSSVVVDAGVGDVEAAQDAAMATALRVDGVLVFIMTTAAWLMLLRAHRRGVHSSARTSVGAGR